MKSTIKYTLVALATTALIACGGSDDESDNSSSVTIPEIQTGVDSGSGMQADPIESESGNQPVVQVAELGPPLFAIAECGSQTVSQLDSTNTNATPLLVDQLVQGQLIEDSSVLNFDLWQVTLDRGNYHLVADAWTTSGAETLVGLDINQLTADGEERIVYEEESDFDTRAYAYLEIEEPATMTIKVAPSHANAMNYVMGIYGNDSAIPSPRFTRCPPTTTISLDETQALELPGDLTWEDYRWYTMELPAGVYFMDVTMFAPDDTQSIGYQFDLFEKFGDDLSVERIGFSDSRSAALSETFQFSALDNGRVWIRAKNSRRDARDMEFTVRR